MSKKPSRLKQSAAVAAVCASFVGAWEGLQTVAYRDVVGVWTVCYGETEGVRKGDRYSVDQCKAMLVRRLEDYAAPVENCIKRPMPDTTFIAFTSLAYNIGTGGFCKSSVARLYNEGRTREACEAMMRFNRAGGVVWRGLTNRRTQERALCLKAEDIG
jgi:lysozyme